MGKTDSPIVSVTSAVTGTTSVTGAATDDGSFSTVGEVLAAGVASSGAATDGDGVSTMGGGDVGCTGAGVAVGWNLKVESIGLPATTASP